MTAFLERLLGHADVILLAARLIGLSGATFLTIEWVRVALTFVILEWGP